MNKPLIIAALAAALLICGRSEAQHKTIVETAIDAGNFETLVTAVKAAGLVDTLNGHTEFTVFAPTDEAFAKLDPNTIKSLLQHENRDQLTQILTYHVLPGRVTASAAYGLNSASTVNGQRISLDLTGESLKVGESTIKVTDIQCSNGVIHVIDTVLMPKLDSIPVVARNAGKFDTLIAAVGAAELANLLSGPGPFTVFAPTDEAFDALPKGTVESLLKPENRKQLVDILKYHVISGRVYAADAVKAGGGQTLLGRNLDISLSAEGISINDAAVLAKNIDASNGVIHVIDSVLIPSKMSASEVMDTLSRAIERGVPVFNSGDHGECSDIYMQALAAINSAGIEGADDHTMRTIEQVMSKARNTHSKTDRAWVLRRGIDELYRRASKMKNTMSSQTNSGR